MKWFLLPVVLFLHTAVLGQGTLKIFVALDDTRNDMDIIDLNTSTIENYGVSVDSTNINFYTTTMSTQVVRITREQLFGPEEEFYLETPVASVEMFLEEEAEIILDEPELEDEPRVTIKENEARQNTTPAKYAVRSTSKSQKRKPNTSRKLKKTKRFKKYRGKCPKF